MYVLPLLTPFKLDEISSIQQAGPEKANPQGMYGTVCVGVEGSGHGFLQLGGDSPTLEKADVDPEPTR